MDVAWWTPGSGKRIGCFDAPIVRLIGTGFRARPLGEVNVRGKTEPIGAFTLR